jgi:hypothetical protein
MTTAGGGSRCRRRRRSHPDRPTSVCSVADASSSIPTPPWLALSQVGCVRRVWVGDAAEGKDSLDYGCGFRDGSGHWDYG